MDDFGTNDINTFVCDVFVKFTWVKQRPRKVKGRRSVLMSLAEGTRPDSRDQAGRSRKRVDTESLGPGHMALLGSVGGVIGTSWVNSHKKTGFQLASWSVLI